MCPAHGVDSIWQYSSWPITCYGNSVPAIPSRNPLVRFYQVYQDFERHFEAVQSVAKRSLRSSNMPLEQ